MFFKIVVLLGLLVPFLGLLLMLDVFIPLRIKIFEKVNQLSDKLGVNFGIDNEAIPAAAVRQIQERSIDGVKLFSLEELAKYTGKKDSPGLYLAIVGEVFDVSKGARHYGPGGGYEFFSGKDGTRAFVTGEFNKEGLIPSIDGLSNQQVLGIDDWTKVYHKDYKFVGRLVGHYYDEAGNPTDEFFKYQASLKEGLKEKQSEADDHKRFPSCNSEWAQGRGGRVWCSTMSGGISRKWSGLPRKYFKPGAASYRCACVKDFGPPSDDPNTKEHKDVGDLLNPVFKEYDNCDSDSESCKLPDD